VAKGRVADVVNQGQGFRQFRIEAKSAGRCAGDLRDLKRVREAAAEVVTGRVARQAGEDLGFAGEAAEGAGVQDAGSIAAKGVRYGCAGSAWARRVRSLSASPQTARPGGSAMEDAGFGSILGNAMGLTSGYTAEGTMLQALCPESRLVQSTECYKTLSSIMSWTTLVERSTIQPGFFERLALGRIAALAAQIFKKFRMEVDMKAIKAALIPLVAIGLAFTSGAREGTPPKKSSISFRRTRLCLTGSQRRPASNRRVRSTR